MLNKIFHIFLKAPGARPLTVLLAMTLSSLSDLLGMGALIPLVSQLASDQGATNSYLGLFTVAVFNRIGIPPNFLYLLLFVGACLITKSLVAFLAMRFVAISVANVGTQIRTRLMKATMNANWTYFVDHQPGEVATMISAQSQMAGDSYMTVSQLIVTVIVGLGLMATAMLVSGKLVIFCVIAIASLAVPLSYILRRAQTAAMKQFNTSANLSVGIQDVITNMKPVKSMQKQSRFVEAFMHSIRDLRSSVVTMIVTKYSMYYGQDILATIMVISGVYIGFGVLHTPISQFIVVGVIFYQMVDVIKRVQLGLQDAMMASAGYYGVMGIVEKAEQAAESAHGTAAAKLEQGIAFRGVEFSYGEKKVLTGVDFTIPAKGITVLIGPSGAGKTTIVDLLVGLYQPQHGQILIDGMDMASVSIPSWRSEIGYVPQELTLIRGSILDNLTLRDPALGAAEAEAALRLAGAWDFVTALPRGMNTDIGTMGAKLSGGQRQRLSLARALIHKPRLLLLDEVTSALDEATEREIVDNVAGLLGKLTIVAITHRPAWTTIASQVYAVNSGTVTAVGGTAAQPSDPAPPTRKRRAAAAAL